MRRVSAPLILAVVALVSTASVADAQGRRRGDSYERVNVAYDGTFTFVRLRYTPLASYGGFGGRDQYWDHDYPRAERHLAVMLTELTHVAPHGVGTNILAADDPELFKYPVAYLSEPGHWSVSDTEAENLRAYLRKGGFLIFDDFVGGEWYNFEEKIGKVLPGIRPIRMTADHPIFHSFYDIDSLDDFVHPYRWVPAVFFGVFEDNDPAKRLLAIVNYNNDIGESWEWSDSGWIPIDISNQAYKLGINYIVYKMTH